MVAAVKGGQLWEPACAQALSMGHIFVRHGPQGLQCDCVPEVALHGRINPSVPSVLFWGEVLPMTQPLPCRIN